MYEASLELTCVAVRHNLSTPGLLPTIPIMEIVAEVATYCVLRNLRKPVIPQHSFKVDEVM